MSKRSKRNDQAAPSLFPFLAVLICTMGAIIVLLVLVVKRADVQANQASAENQQELVEKKEDLRDQLEVQRSQVGILKSLRPDLKERLDSEKGVLGHLVEHVARLRDEYEKLKQAFENIQPVPEKTESTEQWTRQIEQLKQQVSLAKVKLLNKQEQVANAKPAYAIIPHAKGGSGTFRRPIFVECDEDGVTLQPYGITLRSSDFPPGLIAGNPLDLALVMIRDYWNQIDPNQKHGQPYPLFVVRPSGSKAFAASRKAMKSWVDEFGYELVTSDVELKYPAVDEQFRQKLTATIERARARQRDAVATLNRQQALSQIRRLQASGSRSTSGGYRASSLHGGFEKERSVSSSPAGGGRTPAQFASRQTNAPADRFGNRQTDRGELQQNRSGAGNQPQQDGLPNQAMNQNQSRSLTQRNSGFQPPGENNLGAGQGRQASGSQQPSSAANLNAGNSLPAESLSQTRGKDWALPSKANNSIQVRKPIKILVGKDEIRLVEIGKGIKSISFGNSTATAVPSLIEQVWKQIDAWGIAGVNSYWKPILVMHVTPAGESRFQDLKILLSGSGLDLRRAEK